MPNLHRRKNSLIFAACMMALAGCSLESLVEVEPPGTVVDPATVNTPAAARQLYDYAVTRFDMVYGATPADARFGIVNQVISSGVFTDELMRTQIGGQGQAVVFAGVDERTGSQEARRLYEFLHQARAALSQAREALREFGGPDVMALEGHAQALEAYTILWFAEMYCSGIPLTHVPLRGSPVLTGGFTTQEMLERAIALFDSAAVAAGDSAPFVDLARVGKGRALLGLGRFADAAAAVTAVPTGFVYHARFNSAISGNRIGMNPRLVQAMDREGSNGLVWSTDPRAAITTTPSLSGNMRIPAKYSVTAAGTLNAAVSSPNTPIRLADGLEARLIEAEAALAAGSSTWLSILNTLRASCTGSATCAPVPGLTASALPPLSDPGTASARVDLLMRERAMWLYLTGHRTADLRRLARIYNRDVDTLWPIGTYVNPGAPPFINAASTNGTLYGADVVFSTVLVTDETRTNPLYDGCFNLDP